ncbi:MAG TPA: PPOX class F420-dependent oxidoreductase [Chloroflexia bacterium]|jgi:PPOX class probable F420-dependent enzyme|nr:PPOX class F420-dependent oxidoreductase [Chloroflexia bacterium]
MAQTMTADERRRFLSAGTRTMKVATVRADGRPHVVPVWFVLDGDTVVFTTGEDTRKGRDLRRDPRVALCVDDETPPFAFVLMEGTAELIRNAPDLLDWTTRIAHRYMGAGQAAAYGKRNAVDSELLVRVTPAKIVAQSGISD